MTPVEFRGDLWRQRTRFTGLSCGVVCVILRLGVLVEHRLVTDRQMDGQTDGRMQGVIPVEFRGDLWHPKTRVPGLSCDAVCVILHLAVLAGLRLVTDRRTDTGPWLVPADA